MDTRFLEHDISYGSWVDLGGMNLLNSSTPDMPRDARCPEVYEATY